MSIEMKRWTHLGLTAALASTTLLAACGGEGEHGEAGEGETGIHAATAVGEGEGESGEGEGEGEGAPVVGAASGDGGEGEGGVAIDRAGTDAVVFRSALAITEAHIIAARDAYAQGETDAAAEMFAHPVSEVLADVGPYLEAQGVEPFTDLLLSASSAVFDGESVEDISVRTDTIIGALRDAAQKSPDDGRSELEIQLGVVADQIDRAAVMYGIAGEGDAYEPYLDGYGFYKAAIAAYEPVKEEAQRLNPTAATAVERSFELMNSAYPSVLRPAELGQNPAALVAAASTILLTISE